MCDVYYSRFNFNIGFFFQDWNYNILCVSPFSSFTFSTRIELFLLYCSSLPVPVRGRLPLSLQYAECPITIGTEMDPVVVATRKKEGEVTEASGFSVGPSLKHSFAKLGLLSTGGGWHQTFFFANWFSISNTLVKFSQLLAWYKINLSWADIHVALLLHCLPLTPNSIIMSIFMK